MYFKNKKNIYSIPVNISNNAGSDDNILTKKFDLMHINNLRNKIVIKI